MKLLLLLFVVVATQAFKVAIIGGGIGGAATAYYLKKFAKNDDLQIDVFEKNSYIGGRLKHTQFEGATIELGGDAFSSVNAELMEISKELNIQFANGGTDGNGIIGVFDGHTWYPVDPYSPKNWISDAEIYVEMERLKFYLWRNFIDRGNSNTFNTINEFLNYGDLTYFANQSTYDIIKYWGISEDLVQVTWEPLSRNIFDQTLNCNGFAGFTSLLAVFTDPYTVLGGNSELVKKMFSSAKVNMHLNSVVTSVTKTGSQSYTVTYQSTNQQGRTTKSQTTVYDYVVLAAPIEHTDNLQFINFSVPPMQKRQYHHWYVFLISASSLSPAYFGIPSPVPDIILTTDNTTTPFTIVRPMDISRNSPGQIIYKIFSNVNITKSELSKIFVNMTNTLTQHWPYTFPDMAPTQTYQPVQLNEGVYYLNTIESIATAMGASTVAGKNVALLIHHQQQQRQQHSK